MADVDLDAAHPGSLQCGGGDGDALGVGRQPGMADEPQPACIASRRRPPRGGTVEEHGAGVAEAERGRLALELGGDHPRDADGALTHEGEQVAVGVHEAEELGLVPPSHPGGNGRERLDQGVAR